MSNFYIFICIWLIIGFITFIYLFCESAPYGRHIKEGWGISIPAKLGWVVMESPCVVLMLTYALIVKDELEIVHIALSLIHI